jgi:hypothetical protein
VTAIDFDALTRQRAGLVARIDELTRQKDRIDDLYREHLTFGTHHLGGLKVCIQHNRRLNTRKLTDTYPVTQHPELYKSVIDTERVKQHIPRVDLEPFTIEGAPKVVVS